MPNWCENRLSITGSHEQLQQLLTAVQHEDGQGYQLLQHFAPRPANQDDNWYAWNNANWGTKWEDTDTRLVYNVSTELLFGFESAWSPPVEAIITGSKLYPDLTFTMTWHEGGCDFWGALACRNGEHELIEGYISEIAGMTAVDWDSENRSQQLSDNYDRLIDQIDEAETYVTNQLNGQPSVVA